MKKRVRVFALLGLSGLLLGAAARHLELVGSYPKENQTVANPPIEISLILSESADPDSSWVRVRGSGGEVPLGPMRAQDLGLVLLARVEGEMPNGSYTVDWRAGGPDVEPAEGTFRFRVGR